MRILFLIDSLGVGGAERSTFDLCAYLQREGIPFSIICLRRRTEGVQEKALASGMPVNFLKSTNIVSQLREIHSICIAFVPSIVHATLYKSRLRARLHKIIYFRNYKLVESLVTMPFADERIGQRKQSRFRIWLHKLAESVLSIPVNHFIAISEAVKKDALYQHRFLKESRISVIYRGREENPYLQSRDALRGKYAAEFGYSANATVFVHVGRQDFPKNHVFLVRSFLQYLERAAAKTEAILLCLGRSGDMTDKIKTAIDGHPLGERIRFPGHRYDTQEILAQADVFVFPSLFEGLGGSLIEAKASALPVIASDISVFREMLAANSEAFFVKPGDIDTFAEKLAALAADPGLRRQMGMANLASFKSTFLTSHVNRQMVTLYSRISNESTSTRNAASV